jgi:hypothetical protein
MGETSITPAALRHRRDLTIARLCEHFANDHLETGELEELIDRAHKADTLVALDALLAGLPELAATEEPGKTLAPIPQSSEHQVVLAVMGGTERRGAWAPADNVYVAAMMGGVELDFRQAQLAAGVTNVYVIAIMGGVEIIVPPGLRVESNGIGIMGGFEHAGQQDVPVRGSGPILRISGVAIMGGVEIKEKPLKALEAG